MKLLLAPHDDDHALFAAFTCMRENPLIVICLDSHIQPNRGEIGCSAEERDLETMLSCIPLGCSFQRLFLRDDNATEEEIAGSLRKLKDSLEAEVVYAPAIQGGNIHHDMVARAALTVFGDRIRQYTTYTKTKLHTTGDIEIIPTPEELDRKAQALACHVSQLRINRPHFDAVMGKSEWLMA